MFPRPRSLRAIHRPLRGKRAFRARYAERVPAAELEPPVSEQPTPSAINPWARSILRCPATGAELVEAAGPDGAPELHSTDAQRPLAYPVRDGIPIMLIDEARALDQPGTAPAQD